jgi:hypothetical protein
MVIRNARASEAMQGDVKMIECRETFKGLNVGGHCCVGAHS